ncbi:MAG: hypothetical protein SFU87_20250 [Chitinophagaceae bacterium]|nr:hypothetical protein [Chitinophagaceae bacterium]
MRTIKQMYIIAVICFFNYTTYAQSNLTQTFTYSIDDKGAAHVELVQKMTAQQWQQFKATVNNANMSVKKRDIERTMPMYVMENFKYSEDEMERTSKFTFDVTGIADYMGDGKWQIDLKIKDPQVEKLGDNSFMLTTSQATYDGGVYQIIQKAFLPKGAKDAQVNKGTLGLAKIEYKLPVEGSGIPYKLVAGGLLALAGAGMFFMKKKS